MLGIKLHLVQALDNVQVLGLQGSKASRQETFQKDIGKSRRHTPNVPRDYDVVRGSVVPIFLALS